MNGIRSWLLGILWVMACAIFAVGCGGSGASEDSGLTTDTRYASMETLEALQVSLTSSTPVEIATQLAAKMATMAEFSESGVTPDHCAFGRFTDGRLIIFANNRQPAPETADYPAVLSRGRLGGASLAPGQFRLIDTMGSMFQHPVEKMQPLLVAAGMQPASPIQKGTVEDFMGMEGDGFVYLDAHGMSVNLKSGEKVTVIWTGTQVTKELDATYQDMLDAEELVYVVASYDAGQPPQKHYAMTPKFIKKRVSFGKNSVVFFNACHSANADVAEACTAAGAGVYIGWDDSTEDLSAIYAAYFLLDRTLGLYNLEPKIDNPSETQALNIQELIADMAASTCPQTREVYSTSRATKAKLKFALGTESLGGLNPIIREAQIEPASKIITVRGEFGQAAGTVLENVTANSAGTALAVLTWTSSTITVQGSKTTERVLVKVGARSSKPLAIGGTFVLSGNQPINGVAPEPFEARSKLIVEVNGETIYADADGAVRGNRGPIRFNAKRGDLLKISVYSDEIYGGQGDIFITGPTGKTYRIVARTVDYITDKASRLAFRSSWDLRYYF